MFVRVRFFESTTPAQKRAQSAPYVSALGGLVVLLAVSCSMFAVWRLTWDLGWTSSFVIADGIFSHWQVWMALTILFTAVAVRLIRYGRPRPTIAADASEIPSRENVASR